MACAGRERPWRSRPGSNPCCEHRRLRRRSFRGRAQRSKSRCLAISKRRRLNEKLRAGLTLKPEIEEPRTK